jgi:hypothetical protein
LHRENPIAALLPAPRPYHCTHFTQDCYFIYKNLSALEEYESPVTKNGVFVCKDREQKCAVMREWVCDNRGKAEVGLFTQGLLVREQQGKIEKTPFGILLKDWTDLNVGINLKLMLNLTKRLSYS